MEFSPRQRPGLPARLGIAVARPTADIALIVAGFWLAYLLRYHHELGGVVAREDFHSFRDFAPLAIALGVILCALLAARGGYRRARPLPPRQEILLIGTTTLLGFALVAAVVFGSQTLAFSRLLFVYAFVLDGALLTALALARDWLHGQALGAADPPARLVDLALTAAILLAGAIPMAIALIGGGLARRRATRARRGPGHRLGGA